MEDKKRQKNEQTTPLKSFTMKGSKTWATKVDLVRDDFFLKVGSTRANLHTNKDALADRESLNTEARDGGPQTRQGPWGTQHKGKD